MSVRTEPEAAAELEEAAIWYEGKREGLGFEFLDAVDSALEFVTRFTQAGSPVPLVPKDLPARSVPVRGFPFRVVYLEISDAIRILAFAHDRRRPGYWTTRI